MVTQLKKITLHNVKKKFGTHNIIDQAHVLEFYKNNNYALTGPSGSGKSTLLHIIGGFEQPSEGTVYYNDHSYNTLSLREQYAIRRNCLGFVFQFPYLIDECTVLENIIMKALINGVSTINAENKGKTIVEYMDIAHLLNHFPYQLSGGQKQRVALARALVLEPDFLIMDEPTAHLDKPTAHAIMKNIFAYAREKKIGLIISTHDDYYLSYFNTVITLEQQPKNINYIIKKDVPCSLSNLS